MEGAKVTEMTGMLEPAGVLQATEETSTSGQQLLELLLNLDNTQANFSQTLLDFRGQVLDQSSSVCEKFALFTPRYGVTAKGAWRICV